MFTLNLKSAKEIIIKQNDDDTHSIQVKIDVYDKNTNEYIEGIVMFAKTIINLDKMDIKCLEGINDDLYTVQF